jgi:ribosomal protein L16 Arg81 hydroxylase
MLRQWLEGGVEQFLARDYQRAPLAQPNTASPAVPLLDWDTVRRLLEARVDLVVVRNGQLASGPSPSGYEAAHALFAQGHSLVMRGCEQADAGLRGLAEDFAAELEGDVQVQVYATPAGFRSFGWHYDCEDVFIVQTGGTKQYRLRRNTVNPAPTIDAMPRDMHFERETGPVLATTLIAGDWLYVPRGFWHVADAVADSLSISVGVLSPAARGTGPPAGRPAIRRK